MNDYVSYAPHEHPNAMKKFPNRDWVLGKLTELYAVIDAMDPKELRERWDKCWKEENERRSNEDTEVSEESRTDSGEVPESGLPQAGPVGVLDSECAECSCGRSNVKEVT